MPLLKLSRANIHYERSGQGPAVLLIQGVGAGGGGWKPQVDHLSRCFEVVTYDNRGFGRSPFDKKSFTIEDLAEDARELMDSVGWERAHVVGHSMGGLIAQQLAVSHPGRVKSLSLLCTFSKGAEATRLTWPILVMGLQTRIGTKAMRRAAMLRMVLSKKGLASGDLTETARLYGEMMGRDLADSPPVILKQMGAMSRHDLSSSLAALAKIPTLVMSASEDPIAEPDFGRALAEAIPGARFVEIPETSHAVIIERPELVNPILEEHLRKAENQRLAT